MSSKSRKVSKWSPESLEKSKLWYNFHILEHCCVLMASYTQSDRRYSPCDNLQGAATCIVAACMTNFLKINEWYEETLNTILALGAALYDVTLNRIQSTSSTTTTTTTKTPIIISPIEMNRDFFISDFRVRTKIELLYSGNLDIKDEPIKQLKQILIQYFLNKREPRILQLIESDRLRKLNRNYAIWQMRKDYFVFRPDDKPVATLVRFTDFNLFTSFLCDLIIEDGNEDVEFVLDLSLLPFKTFKLYSCTVEKAHKFNREPPKLENLQIETQLTPERKLTDFKWKILSPPEDHSSNFWYHFQVLEHCCVLMASYTQSDRRYSACNNLQGSATCIVAACMTYFVKIKEWREEVVDSILTLGATLYYVSLRRIQSTFKSSSSKPSTIVGPLEMNPDFFIMDFQITTRISLLYSGNLDLDDEIVKQLSTILKQYFLNQYEPRILQLVESERVKKLNRNYTLWQIKKDFFVFHPEDKPVATVIRFKDFNLFTSFLCDLIQHNDDNSNDETLNVSMLPFKAFRLYSCTVEKAYKFDRAPPRIEDLQSEGQMQVFSTVGGEFQTANLWHHFQVLEHCSVLMASCTQSDRRFSVCNNLQGAANCIVAACMTNFLRINEWREDVLNTILTLGAALYDVTLRRIQPTSTKPIIIGPTEMNRDFFISDFQVTAKIELLYSGNLDLSGQALKQLKQILKQYFMDKYEPRILQLIESDRIKKMNRNYALWQIRKDYFAFHPDDRPVAVVVRFKDFKLFTSYIYDLILNYGDNGNDNMMDVSLLPFKTFKLYSCTVEKAHKVDQPPGTEDLQPESSQTPKKKIDFKWQILSPPDYTQVANTWYHFQVLEHCSVLTASYTQSDRRYRTCNNLQGSANCIVAACMTNFLRIKEWREEVVNSILTLGASLYNVTSRRLQSSTKKPTIIGPLEMNREFFMMDFQITTKIELLYSGNLELNDQAVRQLKQILKQFFLDKYVPRILQLIENNERKKKLNRNYAIWQIRKDFFIFHPEDKPVATVVRFEDFQLFTSFICDLIVQNDDSFNNNNNNNSMDVLLLPFKAFRLYSCTVEKAQKFDRAPPKLKDVQTTKTKKLFSPPRRQRTVFWHHFRVLEHCAVLMASYTQSDRRYSACNNLQGSATCIVAACMTYFLKIQEWREEVLNAILTLGATLYDITLHRIQSKLTTPTRPIIIGPLEINPDFFIMDFQITTKISLLYSGNLDLNDEPIQQLKQVLKHYFLNQKEPRILQLIESDRIKEANRNYTLWQNEKDFFIFHPDDQPVATAVRFKNFQLFTSFLCDLINADDNLMDVSLLPFKTFKLYSCTIEKANKFRRTVIEGLDPGSMLTPVRKLLFDESGKSTSMSGDTTQQFEQAFSPGFVSSPVEKKQQQIRTEYENVLDGNYQILCESNYYNNNYERSFLLSQGIAALTMLRVKKSQLWTRNTITDILQLGQIIYCQSIDNDNNKNNNSNNEGICNHIVLYGKNYTPKMDPNVIFGTIITNNQNNQISDLYDGIKTYFHYHDIGIVSGPLIVAIWHEDNYYYMFDPCVNATVYKCKDLRTFVEIYKNNLLYEEELYDFYFITKWSINDKQEIPLDDWYNFHVIDKDRWILRSSMSQDDSYFPDESRNSQCVAMAAMAIIHRCLIDMEDWDEGVMDTILVKGDEYYQQIVQYLKDNDKFKSKLLMVDELIRDIELYDQQIHLDIDNHNIYGIINLDNDNNNNNNADGDFVILNLEQGLDEFFKYNDNGILTAQHQSFAIWKFNENFYYFDSHKRNEHGYKLDQNKTNELGTACCIKHTNLLQLLETILTNLNLTNQQIIYNINSINVNLIDNKIISSDDLDKTIINYQQINDYIWILQCNIDITNNFQQMIPTCLIVGLTWNLLLPSYKWTEQLLQLIINLSSLIYIKSYNYNNNLINTSNNNDEEEEENNDDNNNINDNNRNNKITIEKVIKEFDMGLNRITIKNIEIIANGLISDNLEDDIVNFFDNAQTTADSFLIYQTDLLEICLWKDTINNCFYLFDPYGRDEHGNIYHKYDTNLLSSMNYGEEHEEDDDDDGGEHGNKTNLSSYQRFKQYFGSKMDEFNMSIEEEIVENRKISVLCFNDLTELVYNLIYNTPTKFYNTMEYQLKHIIIENCLNLIVTGRNDWHQFQFINNYWILRGRHTLDDHLYAVENRGKQAVPVCFILIGYVYLYNIEQFTIDTIDTILNYGDRLYTYKLKTKFIEFQKKLYDLTLNTIEILVKQQQYYLIDDFHKKFCIDQKQIMLDFEYEKYTGDIYYEQIERQEINGRIFTTLLNALELLFETKQFGILYCKLQYVVIFKIDNMFYMFDPYARGPDGLPSQNGCACITRYQNLQDLCKNYRSTLPEIGLNQFYLTTVNVKIDECKRKYKETIKLNETILDVMTNALASGDTDIDDNHGCFNHIIPFNQWILTSENDINPNIIDDNGINQYSCTIVYIALTMNLLQQTNTWPTFMIDEILKIGQKFYLELKNQFISHPWNKKLNIYNINKHHNFQIGIKNVSCQCRLLEKTGYIIVNKNDIVNNNNSDRYMFDLLNLQQGIQEFFIENSHGILQINHLILAIWEEYDDYNDDNNHHHNNTKKPYLYLFDPNQRNDNGLPIDCNGKACCMKFINVKLLTNHIIECLPNELNKTTLTFIITPIDIFIDNECYTKSTKYDIDKPPKVLCQNYQRLFMDDDEWKCQYEEEYEQKQRDEKKLMNLGRTKYHQILEDIWLIRSNQPMGSDNFDLSTTISCVLYFNHSRRPKKWTKLNLEQIHFISRTKKPRQWTSNELDQILLVGRLLHYESALKDLEAKNKGGAENDDDDDDQDEDIEKKQLHLTQIVRDFFITNQKYHLNIYVPYNCGHFNFHNLLKRIDEFFNQIDVFLLNVDGKWSTIFKYDGCYYYFDPYKRDLNGNRSYDGCAIVMKFGKIDDLIDQLIRVFQPLDGDMNFRIIPIDIEEIPTVTND